MASKNKIYVGDVGTEIIVDTTISLNQATVLQLRVLKPGSSEEVTWAGEEHEGTKILYRAQPGDFSIAGVYMIQAYIEIPGWKGRGNLATLIVWDIFT
jgi:hypothetical protein